MGGGKGGGGNEAAQARFDELVRQNKVRAGTNSINDTFNTKFNDDFFNKRRQTYIDYATPQVDEQYQDANKQLTFALDRSGNLNSSTRGEKAGQLQKLYDTNKQKIGDDALTFETQARSSVEDARSNLITMVNATGDEQGAANAAIARSTALSQSPAYSPLTQLFTDFTAGLGTQAALEKSFAAGGPAPRYATGLFGPSKNAVKNG